MKLPSYLLTHRLFRTLSILGSSLVIANSAHAALTATCNSWNQNIGFMACPHWYISGNIGGSTLHDKAAPGSGDYVDQTGVGWNVNTGYQFYQIYTALLGGELGYSQYADSREYTPSPSILTGRTEHFSVYGAATGQLPLFYRFSGLGKIGVAYGYARKNAYPVNFSASGHGFNLYWGGGLMYNVTQSAAVVAQWARDVGNKRTGSADLYTLGVQVALA